MAKDCPDKGKRATAAATREGGACKSFTTKIQGLSQMFSCLFTLLTVILKLREIECISVLVE